MCGRQVCRVRLVCVAKIGLGRGLWRERLVRLVVIVGHGFPMSHYPKRGGI